jgi:hypothetical protein
MTRPTWADVSEISRHRDEDHRFGAVSAREGQGTVGSMADTQRDVRVADDSTDQVEESREQAQAAVATVSRMLANPRRIRRA